MGSAPNLFQKKCSLVDVLGRGLEGIAENRLGETHLFLPLKEGRHHQNPFALRKGSDRSLDRTSIQIEPLVRSIQRLGGEAKVRVGLCVTCDGATLFQEMINQCGVRNYGTYIHL